MALPAFSLTAPRDDMSTYWGRCSYFYRAINPALCFETDSSIAASRQLLAQYKLDKSAVAASGVTDAQLWHARNVVESCVHPTTNAPIPPVFRMAAFVPTNLFIVPFMMLPSTIASPFRTVAIHWFNQSYNASINYANRSSDAQPAAELAAGYAAAVAVSVSGALGATMLMRRVGTAPSVSGTLIRAIIPCLSVSFASSANCALMRRNEWSGSGVDVVDDDGAVRGKSAAAGWESLKKCCAARILWNIPCMMLPPLLAAPLARVPALRQRPILTETLLCVLGLTVGVAPALAYYPTQIRVDAASLEPSFHGLTLRSGKPATSLTFYKGL